MAKPMSVLELKGAIVENLNGLDEAQLRELLQIIEGLAPQAVSGSHWDEPEFVAEMDRRVGEYEANPDSMRTSEAVHESVQNHILPIGGI